MSKWSSRTSDQFIWLVSEKKTEAVNAYLIKNSKGEGGRKQQQQQKQNNQKKKGGGGGGGGQGSGRKAVGRTGRSCMGV